MGGFVKRSLGIALCLVTALMLTGCFGFFKKGSPREATIPVSSVSDRVVKLHRSLSADGQSVNMDYDHPHEFTEQAIRNEVGLLVAMEHKWGRYGVGSKWDGKAAFPEPARQRLVPALVTAFKEASASDKILFDLPGRGGRATRGEVYIKEGRLVWIFKEIDGRTYLGKDPFVLDSEDWRIDEKSGMTVTKNKKAQTMKVVRDLSVVPEVTTAAVVEQWPTEAPAAAPPEPLSRQMRRPVAPRAAEVIAPGLEDLEKKLQTLKKWQASGLITDEDYNKQKAHILEQLQQL